MFRQRRKYTFLIRLCFLILILSLKGIDVRATIITVQQAVQGAISRAADVSDGYSEVQDHQFALEDATGALANETASVEKAQKAELVADLGIAHLFRKSDGSIRFRPDPSFFSNDSKRVIKQE